MSQHDKNLTMRQHNFIAAFSATLSLILMACTFFVPVQAEEVMNIRPTSAYKTTADHFVSAAIPQAPAVVSKARPSETAIKNINMTNLKGRLQFQQGKYIVGPGDVLSLTVLDEPNYTQPEVLVRPDGYATFSGIGELYVANEDLQGITALVTEVLKETIIAPEVTVSIKNTRSGTVYLSGAVMQPGMFQFTTNANDNNVTINSKETLVRTDMRLSNILTNSGGVSMNADLHHVTINRGATGEVFRVDLWKILKEGDAQADIWVNSGDHIHVPDGHMMALNDEDYMILLRSPLGPKTIPVRIIGEVDQPGVYYLEGQSPFLNSAVAKAGGFQPSASRKTVAIRRFSDKDNFSTMFIDINKIDMVLRPNDVVFVPERRLSRASQFGADVARILSPFQTAAAAASGYAQTAGVGGWRRVPQ